MRTTLARALATAVAVTCIAAAAMPQEPPVKPSETGAPLPTNRLAKETSPYLRQHQHNPVDWYPWSDEAFAKARAENKLVFVSIGYAACHWCHVMERESFENAAIAARLNADFVSIKVDREERPDVDEIYMAAVQAMGQDGGWPLSVWLLPTGEPFYGGTYFPPEDGHGRPGFGRVLTSLAKAWREQPDELKRGGKQLAEHLGKVLAPELPAGEPDAATLAQIVPHAEARHDATYGGFAQPPGFAPKFPNAVELQVLLRVADAAALPMVTTTLSRMRAGGIYDQLGGGFHRYSTDRAWRVPHFEKMLYDNALLVPCYLDAFVRTGDADHALVARETLDYLLREMQGPEGGFYASQDADSEGEEGRFFAWSAAEFDTLLGDDSGLAKGCYGVTPAGNWEGQNVLQRDRVPNTDEVQRLAAARATLLRARAKRVAPPTDDKVLCAWNGLALRALAAGYGVLGEARYLAAAQKCAAFLCRELVQDGRCLRSWRAGSARHRGYLEDYTLLAAGLVALFEVDGDPQWLVTARKLLQAADARFSAEDGGFYFTADDHEQLVARAKVTSDGATPSGAGVAAATFLRLGLLLGDEALYERGLRVLRANHALLEQHPGAASSFALALQFHLGDPREVVVAGPTGDPRTQALLTAAWRAFPGNHVVALVHEGNRQALEALSPVFAGKAMLDGVPTAYVCKHGTCLAPITDPARLATALQPAQRGAAK